MEVNWYTSTPKLLEGIGLSNVIPDNNFTSILSTLFKAAKEQNDKPFSDEVLKNLQTTLKLNDNEFRLMLTSLAYIVKRSIYFIIKPVILEEDLSDKLKFSPEKSQTFVKIWTDYTKADIGDLEHRQVLQKFSWELNLELASDKISKKAVPSSILQFKIVNNDTSTENITVDMNEEQLLKFYSQIENMQSVIDSLN